MTLCRPVRCANASPRDFPGNTWCRLPYGTRWVKSMRLLSAAVVDHGQSDDVTHVDVLRDSELREVVGRQIGIQVEQHLIDSDGARHQGGGDYVGRLSAGNRVHETGRSGHRSAL